MGVSINTRKAYAEIDEFLKLISEEKRHKIPEQLRTLFKEEKDQAYKKGINPEEDIKNQNLIEETLAIIALLNLQYWCEDEKEKQRLKEVYAKNEQVYQEKLEIEYNPNDIFKKKLEKAENVEKVQEQTQNTQMVEYKEPIIKRIFHRILVFLHLK